MTEQPDNDLQRTGVGARVEGTQPNVFPPPTAHEILTRLQQHGVQPGLERMARLVERLGHPERRFPTVHIAGTNGKGSTAAMVASVLQQAGLSVGLYTSPHLIDLSERMRVNGVPIATIDLDRLVRQVDDAVSQCGMADAITFFEVTTAAAFLYFAEQAVDIGVIEVGLGGRLDATNVITPAVCAITTIAFDHEAYLGKTLTAIAFEKAGILKKWVPVVVGALPEAAALEVEQRARTLSAPQVRLGREITVSGDRPERFIYRGAATREISCPLVGSHQVQNAAVAIGIIEQLQSAGWPIVESHLLDGIRQTRWEGRLETLRVTPRILLDGAHNPAGARALAAALREVDPHRQGRHSLLFGAMQDKNTGAMLSPLLGWADEVILTRPDLARAADPVAMAASLPPDLARRIYPSVRDAVAATVARLGDDDTLLIAGSLFLVGEAKAHLTGQTCSPLRG